MSWVGLSPAEQCHRILSGIAVQVEESGPYSDRYVVAFQMTGQELRALGVLRADTAPPPTVISREEAERMPELTPELSASLALLKKTFG